MLISVPICIIFTIDRRSCCWVGRMIREYFAFGFFLVCELWLPKTSHLRLMDCAIWNISTGPDLRPPTQQKNKIQQTLQFTESTKCRNVGHWQTNNIRFQFKVCTANICTRNSWWKPNQHSTHTHDTQLCSSWSEWIVRCCNGILPVDRIDLAEKHSLEVNFGRKTPFDFSSQCEPKIEQRMFNLLNVSNFQIVLNC